MNNARALEIMKEIKSFKIPRNGLEVIRANDLAIKALEKQVLFENEVSNIRDWFVDNKDCLLDVAMRVAGDAFIESDVCGLIDDVDLGFIVEEVVDEIQKGILNVLDTFRDKIDTQSKHVIKM